MLVGPLVCFSVFAEAISEYIDCIILVKSFIPDALHEGLPHF